MTVSPERPSSAAARSVATSPGEERLTIGELEASYSTYCKAMRLLIREGRSLARIQRTVCWQRLQCLHRCLPGQYRDPDYLYLLLRREINQDA
ncbi:MAG: DUF3136 domain-containing protein [Synechococcaceae cyanobacterium]|nr:DUF3136 domain-containing protein [Synechococcaceae cyanobacterium]